MKAGKEHVQRTGKLWDHLEMIQTNGAQAVVESIKSRLPKVKGTQDVDWVRVGEMWPQAVKLRDDPDPRDWTINILLDDMDEMYEELMATRERNLDLRRLVSDTKLLVHRAGLILDGYEGVGLTALVAPVNLPGSKNIK